MKHIYSPLNNRFLYAAVLILSSLFFSTNLAYASHGMGADLSFSCIGGNQYELSLQLYRDCSGISAPTSVTITIASASCGQNISATLSTVVSSEASPLCPSQLSQSSCNGGTLQGVEVYTYTGTVTLPAQCNDWILSYRLGNRNASITNITAPGSAWMYVETQLNNLDVTCNNSPQFTTPPVPYICNGVPFSYNHGVVDAEGDSLAFSLIAPLDNAGVPVNFVAPFTAIQPMSTTGAFGFDPLTGQMTFTPNGVQNGVIAVEVREYRNGVLISRSIRDMQIVVINCTNNVLTVNPIAGLSGASQNGNVLATCEGNTVQFTISATDPDAADLLTITETVTSNLPGATVVLNQNSNPASMNVTWPVPVGALSSYSFTSTFTDNACPIPGFQIVGYTITLPTVSLPYSDTLKCPGETVSVQLQASGGAPGTYVWSPATGLSCTNCQSPTATTSSPMNYSVVFTDNATGCTATNTININEHDIQMQVNPTSATYCAGDPPAQLNAQLLVNGNPVSGAPTGCYNDNINLQAPALTANTTYTFNGVPAGASGGGTLTVCGLGDLDLTSEFWTINDENGNPIGNLADVAGGTQCTAPVCTTFTLTDAQLNNWNADGVISFTAVSSASYNFGLCTDTLSLTLDYCGSGGGFAGGPVTEVLNLGGGGPGGCYNNHINQMQPALTANTTYNFTGVPPSASGGGTLEICGLGDLDLTSEFWTIQDETGASLGDVFVTGGTQCGATANCATIILTDAQLNSWNVDGTISFTAIASGSYNFGLCADSLSMTLNYCGASGNAGDCSGTTLGYNHVMVFDDQGAPDATTDVTLTFCVEGDYGSGGLEQIEIFGEGGVSLGLYDEVTAGATYSDCGSPGICNTVTITSAQWNAWNDDGQVVITGIPDADVNFSCSGDYSCLTSAQVDYVAAPAGGGLYTWSPAAGLSQTDIANPTASPLVNTTYIVSATDGLCNVSATVDVGCILLETNCEDFNVAWNENKQTADLHWVLSAETDIAGYSIERAGANGVFEEIAWIPVHGNTQDMRHYNYQDQQGLEAGEMYYYRIRQLDLDGQESFLCEVQQILKPGNGISDLSIRPNPTKLSVEILLESDQNTMVDLVVIDLLGRIVLEKHNLNIHAGVNVLPVDMQNLTAGTYYFRLSNVDQGYSKVMKVVKVD
jgi:hypothetical protein